MQIHAAVADQETNTIVATECRPNSNGKKQTIQENSRFQSWQIPSGVVDEIYAGV